MHVLYTDPSRMSALWLGNSCNFISKSSFSLYFLSLPKCVLVKDNFVRWAQLGYFAHEMVNDTLKHEFPSTGFMTAIISSPKRSLFTKMQKSKQLQGKDIRSKRLKFYMPLCFSYLSLWGFLLPTIQFWASQYHID